MGYQTTSIGSIIKDVNYSYLVPAIQREFVWETDQILDLFDSVVREYPIGSFLFWRVSGDYSRQRVKYKFIQDYVGDPIYPEELTNVTYHNQRYDDEPEQPPSKVNLVLDGQQRLTSFYIGLEGSYTDKIPNKRKKRVDSWEKKFLYLNVVSDPSVEKNGRKYQFEFKKQNPQNNTDEHWYRVGDILEAESGTSEVPGVLEEIEKRNNIQKEVVQSYVYENLSDLYNAIIKRDVISYFEETDESRDKILDIFIRANNGGTQLSKADLLLSVTTAQWSREDNSLVAREEIRELVDKMNEHPARAGVSFKSNFVLRCLLLTSGAVNISFTLSNFNENNLREMRKTWTEKKMQKSIISTLDLLQSYGLTTSNIQSKTLLLPIVYYYYANDNPVISYGSKTGKRSRRNILYWLCSLATNKAINSGGTVQTVSKVRNVISEESGSNRYPIKKIEKEINKYGKSMKLEEDFVRGRFAEENNNGYQKVRVLLYLLHFPNVANENYKYEVDHIFPKSSLKREKLLSLEGVSAEKADELSQIRDSIGNLQLIREGENRKKSDQPASEWLETRTEDYLKRHQIPSDRSLWTIENADKFIREREDLLISSLTSLSIEQ